MRQTFIHNFIVKICSFIYGVLWVFIPFLPKICFCRACFTLKSHFKVHYNENEPNNIAIATFIFTLIAQIFSDHRCHILDSSWLTVLWCRWGQTAAKTARLAKRSQFPSVELSGLSLFAAAKRLPSDPCQSYLPSLSCGCATPPSVLGWLPLPRSSRMSGCCQDRRLEASSASIYSVTISRRTSRDAARALTMLRGLQESQRNKNNKAEARAGAWIWL